MTIIKVNWHAMDKGSADENLAIENDCESSKIQWFEKSDQKLHRTSGRP